MKWDLTGERINGLYMGLFPYTGTVENSRVKYGGDVQHTVVIDEPIKVYGAVRDRILVSITEVNRILVSITEVNRILDQQDEDPTAWGDIGCEFDLKIV
jgi:hypothetical protein